MTMIRLVEETPVDGECPFSWPFPFKHERNAPWNFVGFAIKKRKIAQLNEHKFTKLSPNNSYSDNMRLNLSLASKWFQNQDTLLETYIAPKNGGFQCRNLLFQEWVGIYVQGLC